MIKVFFSKVRPDAKIPSKDPEDAGYDIYACFNDDELILEPQEVTIVTTGVATSFPSDYVLFIKERSSTGALGMALRMGVIDSGYRGELLIGINNTTKKQIIISKKISEKKILSDKVFYPYSKAIAQGVYIKLPNLEIEEISYEELQKLSSKRMFKKLGDSGK